MQSLSWCSFEYLAWILCLPLYIIYISIMLSKLLTLNACKQWSCHDQSIQRLPIQSTAIRFQQLPCAQPGSAWQQRTWQWLVSSAHIPILDPWSTGTSTAQQSPVQVYPQWLLTSSVTSRNSSIAVYCYTDSALPNPEMINFFPLPNLLFLHINLGFRV